MLFAIEQLLGINNVDDEKRVVRVSGSDGNIALSGDLITCYNFRLTKDGKGTTRNGFTLKTVATDGHSYWNTIKGDVAFFVDGTNLKLLLSDYTTQTKKTGLTATRDMRYIEHKTTPNTISGDRYIFMGNGKQMYKFYNGDVTTWGDTTARAEDFEFVAMAYSAPPPSNILLSHYARVYVADKHFLLYSESTFPEKFRTANNIPASEKITAVSHDPGHIYIHTINTTKVLRGRDPDDMSEYELPIGAIQQVPISPERYPTGRNIFMSKKGWAYAINGEVGYIDDKNFRLDLPDTAKCYNGYDWVNREVVCTIVQ
jgi:hypothetical protein